MVISEIISQPVQWFGYMIWRLHTYDKTSRLYRMFYMQLTVDIHPKHKINYREPKEFLCQCHQFILSAYYTYLLRVGASLKVKIQH